MAMLSVGGHVYSTSTGPATELLFGTVDGLLILRREGDAWREEHRALQGLHVSSLAVAPGDVLLAGTHNGGVHASLDGGRTWERRSAGIAEEEVYSLAVLSGRVYAGTEPAHLYVSADAGQSWTDLPAVHEVSGTDEWTFPAPPHVAHVKHITGDPRNAGTIYACVEQGGLLRSTDAGASFQVVFDAPATDAHRLTIPTGRPDRLYLTRGDWSIGWEGVYRSLDEGASWQRLWDRSLGIGYPDATLICPDRPDLMFVAGGGSGSPNAWPKHGNPETHVARSRDGGDSWQLLTSVPPAGAAGNIEAMAMNSWPGGFEIFAGTTDGEIYYTADEGETWATIAASLPAISKAGHYRWRARMKAA